MIDPRGLSATQWCEITALGLSSVGTIPPLENEFHWGDWAYSVIQIPGIAHYAPPDPRQFSDWEDWAFRFIQAVPL